MPSIMSIFNLCAAESKDIALKLGTHVVPKQLHSYRYSVFIPSLLISKALISEKQILNLWGQNQIYHTKLL